MAPRLHTSLWPSTAVSLSFESPLSLFSTLIANVSLCSWILLTTGNFTCAIKGKSRILSRNSCYKARNLTLQTCKMQVILIKYQLENVCELESCRSLNIWKEFASGLTSLLVEIILLAKLCKWIKKLTSALCYRLQPLMTAWLLLERFSWEGVQL